MKLIYTLFISSFIQLLHGQTHPKVISVFPPNQLITADASTEIIISFDSPIDSSTITDTSLYIFGRWSGTAEGIISFNDEKNILTFTPYTSFYPGELVFVNLSKRIKNISGDPLEAGYAWHFWIKTGIGTMDLVKTKEINVREPGEGWIQTYGAYAGDLDRDGFTDFIVPNEQANDIRVFMNDGKGDYSDFTIFQMPGGSRPSTNEGADFNLDGLMDIAVGNSTNKLVTVFLGDGTGNFSSIQNYQADLEVRGLMTIDVNGDGFIDIVTANRQGSNITILTNNGYGTFTASDTIEAGGTGETTCSAADVNGDGVLDLFVGALSSREIILLLGNGTGSFDFHTKISVSGAPWFTCAGDMNGDGIADVVSANSSWDIMSVIFCDSMGNFSNPVYYQTGSFPLSTDLGDVDGDGDLDAVTSNYSSGDFTLYENDGTGILINRKDLQSDSSGSCSVFHDRDNDGDLDMTGVDELNDLLILFDNNKPTNVSDDSHIIKEFTLYQNYPNPFNPTTTISWQSPVSGWQTLKVFDLLGREVATLVDEYKDAGIYKVEFSVGQSALADGPDITSGIYFYKLQVNGFSQTKKLILIK